MIPFKISSNGLILNQWEIKQTSPENARTKTLEEHLLSDFYENRKIRREPLKQFLLN